MDTNAVVFILDAPSHLADLKIEHTATSIKKYREDSPDRDGTPNLVLDELPRLVHTLSSLVEFTIRSIIPLNASSLIKFVAMSNRK